MSLIPGIRYVRVNVYNLTRVLSLEIDVCHCLVTSLRLTSKQSVPDVFLMSVLNGIYRIYPKTEPKRGEYRLFTVVVVVVTVTVESGTDERREGFRVRKGRGREQPSIHLFFTPCLETLSSSVFPTVLDRPPLLTSVCRPL